jgi:hypothetical protein
MTPPDLRVEHSEAAGGWIVYSPDFADWFGPFPTKELAEAHRVELDEGVRHLEDES